jgi:hypothetical protein
VKIVQERIAIVKAELAEMAWKKIICTNLFLKN